MQNRFAQVEKRSLLFLFQRKPDDEQQTIKQIVLDVHNDVHHMGIMCSAHYLITMINHPKFSALLASVSEDFEKKNVIIIILLAHFLFISFLCSVTQMWHMLFHRFPIIFTVQHVQFKLITISMSIKRIYFISFYILFTD